MPRVRIFSILLTLILAAAALGVVRAPNPVVGAQATPGAATPAATPAGGTIERGLVEAAGRGFETETLQDLAQAPTTTQAAPGAQVAQQGEGPALEAAIFPGSCDDLGAEPAFALRDVEFQEAVAGEPATPVRTSYSTVEATLDDLVGDEHAVNVSVGAESVACGELGGEGAGEENLFAGLREANGSGLAGIVWLSADDDATRVTVMVAEGLTGAGGSDVPAPPRDDDVPAPPRPDDDTPQPDRGDETPEPDPDAQGRSYVSPSYGYSLTYGAEWEVIAGPVSEEGVDYIQLGNGRSAVDFRGVGIQGPIDALTECLPVMLNGMRDQEGVGDIEPLDEGGDAADAFAEYEITVTFDDGTTGQLVVFQRCLVVEEGASVLLSEHFTNAELYDQEEAARDQLYEGLELP